ncbi:response regulator [Paraglaciecola sp.]|uniref:Hpt domain-containing response regulator n=1 Tax=Paraglaciecola sp. TaxID=1920173 RepID=UPI0030F424AE
MSNANNHTINDDIPTLSGAVLLAQAPANIQCQITHHIESTGARVTLVENGQQVLEQTLNADFDLILMSINMPVLDGIETLKGLRQLGNNTAVYALTSEATAKGKDEFSQQGFKGGLVYPIELPKLYAVLQSHLRSPQQTKSPKNAQSDSLKAKIAELKPIFLASLRTQFGQLNEHIERRDFAQIIKILHIVKGSAGNFGYNNLTDVANSALVSLRLQQFDDAPALLAKVMVCIDKILNGKESCDTKN